MARAPGTLIAELGSVPVSFRRLGEILIADYHVLETDVRDALKAQSQGTPDRLGQFLVRRGILTDRDLATALGQQLGIPVVIGLPRLDVSEDILALVPIRCAEKKLVIPVALAGSDLRRLVLAMADPTDLTVVDALEKLTRMPIQPAIATEEDIRRAFKVFYLGERTHADPAELTDSFEVIRTRLRTSTGTGSDSLEVKGKPRPGIHSGELFIPKPLPIPENDTQASTSRESRTSARVRSPQPTPSAATPSETPDDLSSADMLIIPRDPTSAGSTVGAT